MAIKGAIQRKSAPTMLRPQWHAKTAQPVRPPFYQERQNPGNRAALSSSCRSNRRSRHGSRPFPPLLAADRPYEERKFRSTLTDFGRQKSTFGVNSRGLWPRWTHATDNRYVRFTHAIGEAESPKFQDRSDGLRIPKPSISSGIGLARIPIALWAVEVVRQGKGKSGS